MRKEPEDIVLRALKAAGVTEVTIRNSYKELKSVIEGKGLIEEGFGSPKPSTATLNDQLISSG